jgi:hypothetical protein
MWGAAMDVGGWLRSLGLGQYETNFRDNKIDADLLPRLTDAVLKSPRLAAASIVQEIVGVAVRILSGHQDFSSPRNKTGQTVRGDSQ